MKFKVSNNLIWPLVILIIALGAFYLKPWQTKPTETISVTAEGKAEAVPTIAKITATIESKNLNLDEARKQNQAQVSTVVEKLHTLGIAENDIKTQNISAGPTYEIQIYPRPKPSTNQVSTSLEITIRNFEIADRAIATLTQNGATNLYGPQLTVDDTKLEEAKSKARENAVESARKKAEELAKLSNRKLGKVVKVSEGDGFSLPQPMMAIGGADLREKASQIQPGENEATINLSVDFQLK